MRWLADTRSVVSSRFLDLRNFTPLTRGALLAGFVIIYAMLVVAGYGLKEDVRSLTVIWPASGLLIVVLFMTPVRQWIWVVPLQLAVEGVVGWLNIRGAPVAWAGLFPIANLIDGATGALAARWLMGEATVPRIRQVMQFISCAAIGAAVGALVGAFGAIHLLGHSSYLDQWQLWWAGNWLGSLTVAPVAFTWAIRWRTPAYSAPSARMSEGIVLAAVLWAAAIWIFYGPAGDVTSILHLPWALLLILVVVSFRLPPRWATVLCAVAVVLAAAAASRGHGPFAGEPSPIARVLALQTYLATLAVFTFMMSTVLAEKRRAIDALTLSEQRYRSLVSLSSEAVWRVELDEPMPTGLPLVEQSRWLREHGHVAECNREFSALNERQGLTAGEARRLRGDAPWSSIYLEHLADAARREYSIDALRFSFASSSGREHWLASFSGVVEDGRLVRIWGMARNVTELVQLNERLRREQERLHAYARQLTGAEERARRATAVDLHDGIGQMLTALGMQLEAAASQATPAVRAMLEEMRATIRNVQETTRRVIADLSPPGLYELGLGPALQWLSLYMRGKDNLQVDLDLAIDETALYLDLRVLVFKIVRELLRNVVKHARVSSARVSVATQGNRLLVEVRDQGVGFEWQLELFGEGRQHFGLWSIADRVRDARGDFSVDTAPGKGCSVRLVFPLSQDLRDRGAMRAG
jgi:signal transduction histidine kinase